MKKRRYHHGQLKESYLDIAFDFIQHDDIENLTLKILADKAGTSRTAIYKHLDSKDALIEIMIERGFECFDSLFVKIFEEKNDSLLERFYQATHTYIDFAKQNPTLYRLLFGKKYACIREGIIDIKAEDCSGFGVLKRAVDEGQKDGLLIKESSFKRAVMMWTSLHGFASLNIDGFMKIDESYTELFELMFKDMLKTCLSKKGKLLSILPMK